VFSRKLGHRREFITILLRQTYFTFVQSIGISIGLGFLAGMVFSLQAHWGLAMFGGQDKLGELLVYVIFREITPVATALLLIARSVTAVASELATMKVVSWGLMRLG
jgi:phospholipid/cholesterol/gamma-HCH transport system permease protein